MPQQLMLWELPKINAERDAGVDVGYHFCGKPLTMQIFRKGVS